MSNTLSFELAEIIGHSLGINLLHAKESRKKKDKQLPKNFYRNRFCAGDGHDDELKLRALESMGYMAQLCKINQGRDTIWFVTGEGIKCFREYFPNIITKQN